MTSQPAGRTILIAALLSGIAPALRGGAMSVLLLAAACGSDGGPQTQVGAPGTAASPATGGAGIGAAGSAGTAAPQAGTMATSGQAAPIPTNMAGNGSTGSAGVAVAGAGGGGAPQAGSDAAGASGSSGAPAAVDTKPVLYWLDINGNRVLRSEDFMTVDTVVMRTSTAPDGVAVDVEGGKVYWTNMGSLLGTGGGSLQRANLDGSEVETIVPSGQAQTPKQMQLDLVNGKLYFCDREGAKVWRANLDGSELETIVSGHGFQQLVGVAIDEGAGKFYFTDRNGRKILRANIAMPSGETAANRTDIEELLVFGVGAMPIDLDLDTEHGMLYWTDRQLATVNRAGLDIPAGQTAMNRDDAETIANGVTEAIGLSLDVPNNKMYFSELGGQVSEAALDGSGARGILSSGSATGVAIAHLPKP